MATKLKCVALSAFVLPGLGQLCLGRRVKGGVMIALDNIFILAALFIALRSVTKLMVAGGGVGAGKVLSAIQSEAPYARWVLGAFLVLWIYGVVDAILDKNNSGIN